MLLNCFYGIQGYIQRAARSKIKMHQREPWLKWQAKHEDAWIAIGPEGDFSVEEIQFLNGHGASPVHLGDLRLRTETAGVAAMAQFS